MIGGNQPPFRMPCGGVIGKPRFFIGPRYQQGKRHDLRDRFANATTVPNRDHTANVPPYEIYVPTSHAERSCEEEGAPIGGGIAPVTNVWTHSPGDQLDFSTFPRARGWKGAMSGRSWHGRYGYDAIDAVVASDVVDGCGGSSAVSYRSYQAHPERTRFCSQSASATHSVTAYLGGVFSSSSVHHAEVFLGIAATSGRWASGGMSLDPNSNTRNRAIDVIGIADWTMVEFVARCTPIFAPGAGLTVTWNGGSATVTGLDSGGAVRVFEQLDYDIAAGTLHRETYHWGDTPGTYGTRYTDFIEDITISEASLSYHTVENEWETGPMGGLTQLAGVIDVSVVGSLANANTDEAIIADCKALLGEWNLADDAQHPWRFDGKLQCSPLVTRDERGFDQAFNIVWRVSDYGNPLNTFGDPYPAPGWLGEAQVLPQTDWATGSQYGVVDMPVTDGQTFGANVSTSVLRPTSFAIVGGSLPPGLSMDPTTGVVSGTVDGSSWDPDWGGEAHYAITVLVTGETQYSGHVLGAPKPAGYQDYFDDAFLDYRGCCHFDETGSPGYDPYLYGVGQLLSTYNSENGAGLPGNSTQWPNRRSMIGLTPGAWIRFRSINVFHFDCPYSGTDSLQRTVMMGKYAEILETWPSLNAARPAGQDKFRFDEGAVYGVGSDFDGTSFTPMEWGSSTMTPAASFDPSGVWGGPAVGGFFSVTFSGGQVHLGTKIYDVPTGWTSESGDDDACFGRLRWPNAPSILGRAAVSADVAGTSFTFASPQVNFGLSASQQEVVDLFDDRMNLLATTTATRASDSTFSTVATAPGAKWCAINGTTWYFGDDLSKGDFAVLTWQKDNRTGQEYDRLTGTLGCAGGQVARPTANLGGGPVTQPYQDFTATAHCLPILPCAPRVACISPNGEQFPNGQTTDFPGDAAVELDGTYGTAWQGFVVSAMVDPLWQQPHKPILTDWYDPSNPDTLIWRMDDVTCLEDYEEPFEHHTAFHKFYRHAPMLECLMAVPCSYGNLQSECGPALPDGLTLGFVSPVTDANGQAPPGYIGFDDDFSPASVDTAFFLNKRFCDAAANPTCDQYDYAGYARGCT